VFRKKKQPKAVAMEMTCTICTHGMDLAVVYPQAYKLPEMHTYRCTQCSSLRTIEVRPEAAQAA
jgi:hypothetical protein